MARYNIKLSDINLDWENPRLASHKKVHFYKGLSEDLENNKLNQQFYLMFNLLAYFKVEELIFDMIKNPGTTKDLLESENILIYPDDSSSDKKEYIVVEGNRRVCALKIIYTPSLLSEIQSYITDSGIPINNIFFKEKCEKIEAEMYGCKDFFMENSPISDQGLEVFIKSEREQLINMTRKMHVVPKHRWKSIDASLFDLERFQEIIKNNPELVIEDAIDETLRSFGVGRFSIKQRDNFKQNLFRISFYNYFLEVASHKSPEDFELYSTNIIHKYLPITDVLRGQLKQDYGIHFQIAVEDGEIIKELKSINFPDKKSDTLDEICLNIILKIFEMNIPNGEIRNKEKFKNFLEKNEININYFTDFTEEPTSSRGMKIYYSQDVVRGQVAIPLQSSPINILEYVHSAYDDNGKEISKEDLIPKVDGNFYSRIPKLEEMCTFRVIFYTKGSDKPFSHFLTIKTYQTKIEVKPYKKVPIQAFGSNISWELGATINPLIEQINSLKWNKHWMVIATCLRCFYEGSVLLLREECSDFSDKIGLNKHQNDRKRDHITDSIEDIVTYISADVELYNILDNQMGLRRDECIDYININYLSVFKSTQAFNHCNHDKYEETDVKAFALVTSKWLNIINSLVKEKRNENNKT